MWAEVRMLVEVGHLIATLRHPSGSATGVTILHDCQHPSALRVLLPSPDDELLNVREKDDRRQKALSSRPDTIGRRDGGELGTAAVSGKRPARVSLLRHGTER